MSELLTLLLLRQTLVVLLLGSIALLLLRRFQSPRVHRLVCLLVLMQGVFLFHWSLPAPTAAEVMVEGHRVPAVVSSPPSKVTVVKTETVVAAPDAAVEEPSVNSSQAAIAATSMLHRSSHSILLVWFAGAGILFGLGVFRFVRFHLTVPLTPTTNQKLKAEWDAACQACGVEPVPMFVSEHVGPGVMVRPSGVVLVAPCGFLESLSSLQRRLVLLHEAQHVKRRDLAKSFAIRGLLLLQWFNPIAWKLANRFVEAAEWACDDRCRRLLPEGISEFARTLLNQTVPTALLPQPAANMHGHNLATRIRRLLSEPRRESKMKRTCLLSAFLVLPGLAAFEPWSAAFAKSSEPEAASQTGEIPPVRVQMAEKKLTATELIADAESRLVYEAVTPSLNYGEVTVKGTRYVRMPVKITAVKAPFPQFFTIETSSPFMLKITGKKPGLAVATATDEAGQEWKIGFNVSKPAATSNDELLEAKLKQLQKLQAEIEKLRAPLLQWKAELYEVPVEVLKELTGAEDESALYKSDGSKLENGLLKKLKENKRAKRRSVPTVVSRANRKATVLSGGEMPIVVPAGDGKVAIEFRSFGLSLEATARVASDNSLVSKIRFEHSVRDFSSAVTVDGIQVPGFTVQRSEIQANIKAGETLQMIGPASERSKPVPFENPLAQAAADIGILDAKVKKTKTALVVFLTPSFVKPQKSDQLQPQPQSEAALVPSRHVTPVPIERHFSFTPNRREDKWVQFGDSKRQ